MRRRLALLAAVLGALVLAPAPTPAQAPPAHPFGAAPQRANPPPVAAEALAQDSLVQTLRRQQKELQKSLVDAVRRMRAEASVQAFVGLVLAGFVYGVLHAAGPGHGKAVISSYLFASGGRLWPAVRLSFLSVFAQAATAIVLIGGLVLVLNLTAAHIRSATSWLETVGAIFITAIGGWMTWRAVAAFRRRDASGAHDHAAAHDHGDACHPAAVPGRGADRSVILAIGLRPCSGALLVLVFGQAIGMFAAGMAATLAMAVGTGLTVAALALLTVASRRLAERIAFRPAWTEAVHLALALAGSLAVTALGLLLLLASVGSEGPVL
jgi:ABC-type nickel/cobalt efflux system permease component RcnA